MRMRIKKMAEWTHAALILAMILPLVYSLGAEQPDTVGQALYYKCLIVILPIAATDLAIGKCKRLLSYLAASAVIFIATAALGTAVAASMRPSQLYWGYLFVLLAETAFVILQRMAGRLRTDKDQKNADMDDPSWRPYQDSLKTPALPVLLFFAVAYAAALNLNNPDVCNAALFAAILYTLITLLYRHICETETYLGMNRRTCNLPSRRIYGIGNAMLAIFILLLLLVVLPSLLTAGHRHYRDLRKSTARIQFDWSEVEPGRQPEYNAEIYPPEMLAEQFGEAGPTPAWVTALSYLLEASVVIALIAALIRVIYNTFHAFREAADDNGDIVEELTDTNEAVRIREPAEPRRRLSERERMRREYRRYIRRYRKERPARYESPTEIEINAGVADHEECRELHKRYELARYRQEN